MTTSTEPDDEEDDDDDDYFYLFIYLFIRGVTILQILDSITFSILRSRFDSILDFYIFFL